MLVESNIGRRSREIATSNQDNLFHPLDSESKPSGEGKPMIDIFEYPLAKIIQRQGVFTSSIYREGQYCTSPPRVRK